MKFRNDLAPPKARACWNPEVWHCADGNASVLATMFWSAHSRLGARIGGGRSVLFWCRRVLAGATQRMHVVHALHAASTASAEEDSSSRWRPEVSEYSSPRQI